MNKALLNKQVQKFISENLNVDLSALILKGSPFPEVSIQELATQISGLKRAKSKLPTWFKNVNILYPPNLNLEQTSSEITANYKASLVEGDKLIDLTGGFGIDSYFFSKQVKEVIHCEMNPELSAIAAYNFEELGATNITCKTGDSIEILKEIEPPFDWIYIDPSRRDDYGGKVFLLEQCTPNVPELLFLFFRKATNIMVKTSPLLDIKSGINELKYVNEIHIVAVNQDVKELVWLLNKKASSKIKIKTIDFQKKETQVFETYYSQHQSDLPLSAPQKYLYEPNPAIMKSGMFRELAIKTGTFKLHPNSHLYTSEEIKAFPGRAFVITDILNYNKKILKKRFKFKKANITTRNFPRSVAELRKELKINDGGSDYLFFTTNLNDQKIVILGTKA
ncbi:class I SAM-dependent methyltransferase [Gillisia sp. M10.2A]|uniref:Class I SAM-dependent methyltransferase n=1 Tax=Gillisia lutea TaxID=2909668 RepID=A0ABS9EJG3_9FLAO|nr:class I SAM-dependent methyltransferase [Gillisia lutea]MCF4101628.1 class I SAM-dependent methyltransferase [Gillisia lutea]